MRSGGDRKLVFRHRWVRRFGVGLALVVALVVVSHIAGGWYFSNVLRDDALDASNRRAELTPQYGVDVVAVDPETIVLDPRDSGDVRRPGVWGIAWEGGYGIASNVLEESPEAVARSFRLVAGTDPAPGTRVEIQSRAFPDDPGAMLGTEPQVVEVPGPLGDYESWYFPGERSTGALLLHGNTPDRLDMARLLPTVLGEGYPVLLVSVRNDPGAPEDPSGQLRYGATEWEDLEAAVAWTTDHGASDVVLVGPSMGGGVVMSFLEHSDHADDVRAVVLDAPMLDFGRTVDFQAGQESLPVVGLPLPASLIATAKWISSWRFDLDWSKLDYLSDTDSLRVPILVFHGTDDDDVPIATSRALALARPDLVTLVEVEGATHLTAWNQDPEAYERELTTFLQQHAP